MIADGCAPRRAPSDGTARHSRSCLPAQVEAETVAGLPVREPFEGLEDHDRGQDARGHRRAAERRVQIAVREVVVGEHLMAVLGEELVDRPVTESITEHRDGIIESALLVCVPKGHAQVLQAGV
jgi:hypothetical protein